MKKSIISIKSLILGLFVCTIVITVSTSCTEESKAKNAMGLAKMMESNFAGKDEATAKINALVEEYKATLTNDSTGFENRFDLFSHNYLNKVRVLIHHANSSNRKSIERLMIAEQMQVFNFRTNFTYEQLQTLTLKEILKIQDEKTFQLGGSSVEFKNLLFYNSKQASGAFKGFMSISPVLFDKEGNEWKIDIYGDPLHQKMKEEKLASLQQKSYEELKQATRELLEVNEESWIPLKDR